MHIVYFFSIRFLFRSHFLYFFFFFNDTATTEIYTLSLHDALPISLESEELRIRRHDRDSHGQLERVLEELAQREVINTGVIVSPDVRFYPVSVDRFIREILDAEFRE